MAAAAKVAVEGTEAVVSGPVAAASVVAVAVAMVVRAERAEREARAGTWVVQVVEMGVRAEAMQAAHMASAACTRADQRGYVLSRVSFPKAVLLTK